MRAGENLRLSSALILLVTVNLFWAGQGVAVKLLDRSLNPLAIAVLPFYGTALLGLAATLGRSSWRSRWRQAWAFRQDFVLIGIFGQFLAQVGMTIGISYSLAANGAILSLLIPVLSALIATWLLRERLTPLRLSALGLGLIGVLLLSPAISRGASPSFWRSLAGNMLITTGCLGSAFYNVYSKRLLDFFSDLEILFFSYLSTAAFGLPMLILFAPHCLEQLARFHLSQWATFAYLAIILYGLSMVLFLRALRTVDVIVASVSLYLIPLFGVGFAILFLKERLSIEAIFGAAMVACATLVLFRFDVVQEH